MMAQREWHPSITCSLVEDHIELWVGTLTVPVQYRAVPLSSYKSIKTFELMVMQKKTTHDVALTVTLKRKKKKSQVKPIQNILFCACNYHNVMHSHLIMYGPAIHFNANPQNAQDAQ